MLLFIFLSGALIYNIVLTSFVLRDRQLILNTLRWSVTLWLGIFGLFACEVVRKGFLVHGETTLPWYTLGVWILWFIVVGFSVYDVRLLIPAIAVLICALSYPKAFALFDSGLLRLGWVDVVHNPVGWVVQKFLGWLMDRTVDWVFGGLPF
ncbi:hypothetical protein F5Y09DRAFT_308886 [Xylaria sp. FL1042]|nr:hypothetical protein F5Y09DRAFT_308886 [Xylaria sp. FL1042]